MSNFFKKAEGDPTKDILSVLELQLQAYFKDLLNDHGIFINREINNTSAYIQGINKIYPNVTYAVSCSALKEVPAAGTIMITDLVNNIRSLAISVRQLPMVSRDGVAPHEFYISVRLAELE